jgi:hypothetical protein
VYPDDGGTLTGINISCYTKLQLQNPKERGYLGEKSIDGRIILKCT